MNRPPGQVVVCDECDRVLPAEMRHGTAGKGDPAKALWIRVPPDWWITHLGYVDAENRVNGMFLLRCPECIDNATR